MLLITYSAPATGETGTMELAVELKEGTISVLLVDSTLILNRACLGSIAIVYGKYP
jgi:hypothetical protein